MGSFTYEEKNPGSPLETFEWDNVWWEHTENKEAKRILYIGDSISCGTRGYITALAGPEYLCDGFGTSKALDNPFFKPSLELFLNQHSRCDLILFNNGLHGWHLSEEEYGKYYEDMLSFLTGRQAPVAILLTTDVLNDPERNCRVEARNAIAAALGEKHGARVIDLYRLAVDNPEAHTQDCVHFTPEGYELLAKYILKEIGL